MNVQVDTLAFAERFEEAGFGHEQARALAAAFGQTQEAARDGLVTKDYLDVRMAELRAEIQNMRVEIIREVAVVGKDVSGRLWSTITIIAGVSTAISATIGAGVALILKWGGI